VLRVSVAFAVIPFVHQTMLSFLQLGIAHGRHMNDLLSSLNLRYENCEGNDWGWIATVTAFFAYCI